MTFASKTFADGAEASVIALTFGRARLIWRRAASHPLTYDNGW